MSFIDIVLLAIIIGASLYGMWGGVIKRVSQLLGLIAGIWGATFLYKQVATLALTYVDWNTSLVESIVFIVLMTVISGLVSYLVERVLSLVHIIPFAGLIDRLLGATIAGVFTIIVLSLLFISLKGLPFAYAIIPVLENSYIARYIILISDMVLPNVLNAIQIISHHVS